MTQLPNPETPNCGAAMQHYRPPYDSPIEDALAWTLSKHLEPSIELQPQFEVPSFAGTFRLDFLAVGGGRQIGLECDGRKYHGYTRDMFRDSIILGSTSIDAIYRFRGSDISHRLEDALYSLSTLEPDLFSARGRTNLKQLASRSRSVFDGTEFVITVLGGETIWMRALRRDHPNPVWKRLFTYASAHRHLPLEEIIRKSDADGMTWFRD
jgi:hypothetical protein